MQKMLINLLNVSGSCIKEQEILGETESMWINSNLLLIFEA